MRPAGQLLLIERAALPAVLDRSKPHDLELETVCTGWSVRDVLAHCGAALGSLVRGSVGGFTPDENQRDVDERASWPIDQVLTELFDNMAAAAGVIDELDGLADGLGLGEWVHGGDVRDALGEPDAYASSGIDLALGLISARSMERAAPGVELIVDGTSLPFGAGSPKGRLITDAATLVRVVAGRNPDSARYELSGLVPRELVLFS